MPPGTAPASLLGHLPSLPVSVYLRGFWGRDPWWTMFLPGVGRLWAWLPLGQLLGELQSLGGSR